MNNLQISASKNNNSKLKMTYKYSETNDIIKKSTSPFQTKKNKIIKDNKNLVLSLNKK